MDWNNIFSIITKINAIAIPITGIFGCIAGIFGCLILIKNILVARFHFSWKIIVPEKQKRSQKEILFNTESWQVGNNISMITPQIHIKAINNNPNHLINISEWIIEITHIKYIQTRLVLIWLMNCIDRLRHGESNFNYFINVTSKSNFTDEITISYQSKKLNLTHYQTKQNIHLKVGEIKDVVLIKGKETIGNQNINNIDIEIKITCNKKETVYIAPSSEYTAEKGFFFFLRDLHIGGAISETPFGILEFDTNLKQQVRILDTNLNLKGLEEEDFNFHLLPLTSCEGRIIIYPRRYNILYKVMRFIPCTRRKFRIIVPTGLPTHKTLSTVKHAFHRVK